MAISISSPTQNQVIPGGGDVVASGGGGPCVGVDLGSMPPVTTPTPVINNDGSSWTVNLGQLPAAAYSLTVVGEDQSEDMVDFSVT